MSFPRYPAYKDSGVHWLGAIPDNWFLAQLRHCIARLGSGGTPESGNPEYWAESDEPDSFAWVAIGDMSNKSLVDSTAKRVSRQGLESKGLEVFPAGSLLYSIYASLGKVAILGTDAAFNQALLAIIPDKSVVAQSFLRYWLESLEEHLAYYSSSNTQANLNAGKVLSFPVVLPSIDEQSSIASFLDHETAKIDALIAEQQRLIELLQEKRQAVISHAVTKGLNPDAPMKDTGVEWLGEMPEHWEIKRMKHVARMESGHTPDRKVDAYWKDCDIPWVSLNDTGYLKDNDYICETAYSINALGISNSSARLLPERVVVFSRDATIGRCAITTRPMAVSQHFIAWVCGPELIPEYLLLRLRSMTAELDRLTAGATLKTIGMPDVRTLVTPLPPLSEQVAIINNVVAISKDLDGLLADTSRAIGLLQERRSALISATVTGQIDVRGLVPEAVAA